MIWLELFLGFLRVGAFSFGGAYGAIPLIRDVVISYGWMDDEVLSYMIAVSESTPGPIMVNVATYIGNTQGGLPGAILATAAVVLPAFVIILLIMRFMKNAMKNRYVQAVLGGLKACIIGIILATGVFMMLENCIGSVNAVSFDYRALILTGILAAVYIGARKLRKGGMSPILLIAIAAAVGVIIYR